MSGFFVIDCCSVLLADVPLNVYYYICTNIYMEIREI